MEFWALPPAGREEGFAELRATAPVSWHRQPESQLLPESEGTGGYWAIVRYDDVREVSRDPERFCSGQGVMFEDIPAEMLEASQSFLAMDDPRHATLRKLVAEGFKPRAVKRIEDGIRADARTIVDELGESFDGDFVEAVAKRLPMMTIMRMLGVPEEDREAVLWGVDAAVSWNDPDFLAGRTPLEVVGESMAIMTGLAFRLCAERRERPADDLITDLVQADVGRRAADRRRDRRLPRPALGGRQRHDSPHDLARDARAVRLPRPARAAAGRSRRPDRHRGRGVRPLGVAGDDLPPHGDARHRDLRASRSRRARRS